MTKNDWVIGEDNFKYFNEEGKLIVHIVKTSQGIWEAFVLGYDKVIKHEILSVVLKGTAKAIKECGWEN